MILQSENTMPLIKYIYQKDYAALKRAVSDGVDLNIADMDGRTAIIHAVLDENADSKMVQFLIQNGANPNIKDKEQNWTALHFAASGQKLEVVTKLLDLGAIVDTEDIFGNTPLWRCVLNSKINLDVVKLLLEKGANPNKLNKKGVSPRILAESIGKTEMIEALS